MVDAYTSSHLLPARIQEIASLMTQFDVLRFMRRLTEAYGRRTFMVGEVPSQTTLEILGNVIVTNWPSELISLYDQSKFLQTSPVLRRLRNQTTPFQFVTADIASERQDERVKDLLERFGITTGAIFPVADLAGRRAAVALFGEGPQFSVAQMMELGYIAGHLYERLATIRDVDAKINNSLSEREVNCLTWTAAGKTSAEIANILDLSEHTVNHYLNRATKKLVAVNRTQAVAKALRLGIIQ
ncbi:LuxR family transcriptional regulator [Rhizobium oryzicola]|uniref:LuxR family transcriptional regulator n=1 Tax=Rhizobium oryzicola TaxID=1232668 RepID=A0ABT8SSY7_9HYPH|nr:LuxR family transcriptional regulator [Rhizobium oryzicola]MDO1581194.1 LuxR family transcriptional regulator [Rhizobium oryzicola]